MTNDFKSIQTITSLPGILLSAYARICPPDPSQLYLSFLVLFVFFFFQKKKTKKKKKKKKKTKKKKKQKNKPK
jgi:uncharacterized membrane protein YfcA